MAATGLQQPLACNRVPPRQKTIKATYEARGRVNRSGKACELAVTGLPESPLENIRLENVTAIGKHGFIANNINGLTLNNVSVEARDGKTMRFDNVK